jgi:hypothetical protein
MQLAQLPNSPTRGTSACAYRVGAPALGGVVAEQFDWRFREFRPYLGRCLHADCTGKGVTGRHHHNQSTIAVMVSIPK